MLTSRSNPWISRSGDFLDNYDATTDYFTPLRMYARYNDQVEQWASKAFPSL
jgi:hypothetical protein